MAKAETLQRRWLAEDDEFIDSSIRALLQAPNGRHFLWWLLEQAQVGRQPYQPDPLATAFNCGELNVGQKILARMLQVDPTGYTTLMKEQADARSSRDAALIGANSDAEPDYGAEPEPGPERGS